MISASGQLFSNLNDRLRSIHAIRAPVAFLSTGRGVTMGCSLTWNGMKEKTDEMTHYKIVKGCEKKI